MERVSKPTEKNSRPPADFPKTVNRSKIEKKQDYKQAQRETGNTILSNDELPHRRKAVVQKKMSGGEQ